MLATFGDAFYHQLGLPEESKRDESSAEDASLPPRRRCAWTPEEAALPDHVTSAACGMHFSLALTASGQVYQWGIVFQEIMSKPTLLYLPAVGRGVTHIACGAKHAVALLDGGSVYSWGCGAFGRLGHGDQLSRSRPAPVSALDLRHGSSGDAVVRIAAGGFCSGAVTANGQVYVWGFNRYGQCGTGDCRDVIVPQPMRAASLRGVVPTVLLIARHHTALLSAEGRLYTWGAWTIGRLGHSASVKPVPVSVPEVGQPDVRTGIAAAAPGAAGGGGSGQHVLQLVLYPTAVRGLQHKMVVAAAVGGQHMLASCADGTLFSWGRGSEGALGHGNLLHQRTPRQIEALSGVHIAQLSAGAFHSAAVTADGQLFMWGAAGSGQLGLPPKLLGLPPTSGSTGEEEEWQRPRAELNISVPQLVRFGRTGAETRARPRVAVIACGAAHTVALVLHAMATSPSSGGAAPNPMEAVVASGRYSPTSAAAAAAAAALGSDDERGAAGGADGGAAAYDGEADHHGAYADDGTYGEATATAAWDGYGYGGAEQAYGGEEYGGEEYGEYTAEAYYGADYYGEANSTAAVEEHLQQQHYDQPYGYGDAPTTTAVREPEEAAYSRPMPVRPRARAEIERPQPRASSSSSSSRRSRNSNSNSERNTSEYFDGQRRTSASHAATAGGFVPTEDDILELFSFCRHNRLKEVQPLLRAGFPVDVRDENGNTPLIVAAQNGLHRLARVLLRFGADMNAQNVRLVCVCVCVVRRVLRQRHHSRTALSFLLLSFSPPPPPPSLPFVITGARPDSAALLHVIQSRGYGE